MALKKYQSIFFILHHAVANDVHTCSQARRMMLNRHNPFVLQEEARYV